ncbi:hypothetical protein FB45DRAFT_1027529 [Roridomyces roridus]|uniref:Uncharacterized protein n=1 Tax=Roridomyces roridus TaxID=1738132 RepID=A0AAD7BT64_9AGAR|nr:hypothetical protein FB45DRAFT_1027529 [Roridomyces roridus]
MQDSSKEQLVEEPGTLVAARYSRRVVRPLTIIVGQLAFVALVLAFLLAIHARGYLLPPRVFGLNANAGYPEYQAYVYVTFVSHLLSMASSYLFSQAVLYLMQIYLAEPLPVALIGIWLSLSKRRLIFERRRVMWALTCAAIFFASTSLTPSWTSLLTPTVIVIRTPLNGSEIDLSSPLFNDKRRFQEIWNGTNGIDTWLKSFRSVTSNGGAISADSNIGLDFGNWTYFGTGTTRGILPVDYSDAGAPHPTWLITSNTERLPPIGSDEDPDRSIRMTQQGLSANVSCKHPHLDGKTNLPLALNRTQVNLPALNGLKLPYNVVSIAAVCPNGERVQTDTITSSLTYDTIGALSCFSSNEIDFIVLIDLSGKYGNNSMVCIVTPKTMEFKVIYDLDEQIVHYSHSHDEPTQIEPAHPWLSFDVMQSINDAFNYGQTAGGNVIGDTLFESYLAGVASFTATAMKSRLASRDGSFINEPPRALHTTCIGWKKHEFKHYLMLLPILLVALASIALVVFAEYKSGFKGIPSEHVHFNPGNPLHIMEAAAAGGMPDAFGGLSEQGIKRGKNKQVQLGNVDGKIGFCDVHAG